jgi:hypothetical protein
MDVGMVHFGLTADRHEIKRSAHELLRDRSSPGQARAAAGS